jgi:conjugative relaxase-like TrwC/TraI family protein
MLSPKTQMNLRNAKEYFREHLCVGDYYAQGAQVRGQWFGHGAEMLGLKGHVSEQAFVRLCEGLHPATGERLTMRRNTKRQENGQLVANRRVLYDFTISPPKSVSVVGLLQDDRISAVHDEAIRNAMVELERFAETRVRKDGKTDSRITANVVGAAFRHESSRDLDPHLHTHCVLLNATFDPVEQRWKALEPGLLLRAQKLVENCYYHELCRGLRKLGYEIEANRRDFEIKGVPASVIERFSKRHQQIDAETQRRVARGEVRGNLKDTREHVARDSRKRKADATSADRLRADWQQQLASKERDALRALRGLKPARTESVNAAEFVNWADEHLFERRAVVDDFELLSAALTRGRGQNIDVAGLRQEIARRDYVREDGSMKLTSREVLRAELAVIFAAQDGRGRCGELAPDHVPARALSAEQTQAVQQILSSQDFITLFRGGAGTGKSFALKEVERAVLATGQPVIVLAPQRQQVTDLERDGLRAQTVAQFLTRGEASRGAVVMVDEAGQIGAKQLREVIALVHANRGRLILSGDTRQHGAVAASDALRAIEAYGGVRAAEIVTIRRQDPDRARTATERSEILRYRSAVKAAAAGDVKSSFEVLDRLGWVRELPEANRRDVLAREYMAALDRRESALVVAQTWSEVRAVNEAIRESLRESGKIGEGAPVTTWQAVDATTAQKRESGFYEPGQRAFFLRGYSRFTAGECCEIIGTNERGVVLAKNGRRSTMSFRYAERIAVVTPTAMPVAAGDRLQLKFNGRSLEGQSLNNGELVTVHTVRRNGEIVIEAADGSRKTLGAEQRLFNRGYAVTSYASQGKTVDTVLMADAGNPAATNRNQWYVAISRGRKRVVVFTPDKAALRGAIHRAGDRALAVEMKSPAPAVPCPRNRHDWMRRAREVIDTLHRINFLKRRRAQTQSIRHRL